MIIKWIQQLTIILLTIVANQNEKLVPGRTDIIRRLTVLLDEMRDSVNDNMDR